MLYIMSNSLYQTHHEIVKIGYVLTGNQDAFEKFNDGGGLDNT